MSFRGWIAAVALTGMTAAPSAAMAQAVKIDDGALKTSVETKLKASPSLKQDHIDVDVASGVVTLTGTVRSAAQKATAARLAKVAGVTTVENKIEVDPNGTKMDKTEAAAKKAAEKTKDAAVKVGETTKDAAVGTAGAVTNGWITTKLKADFVNEDTLKGSDINVDTDNHVVTLKGTVMSAAGKARAEEIARTTKGVNRVINTLVIGPKK